ncbi:uncharacterized protein LOC144600225 [Rhinoraja longicauda]
MAPGRLIDSGGGQSVAAATRGLAKTFADHFKNGNSRSNAPRMCKTKSQSGSYDGSSNSESTRSSQSCVGSEATTCYSTLSSETSERSRAPSQKPEALHVKDFKSRLPKRTTSHRAYENRPPGMSLEWYHHLNKKARILRNHGLILGHLSQFVN